MSISSPSLSATSSVFSFPSLPDKAILCLKHRSLVWTLIANNDKTKQIMERIKELEHQGYQFEGADASLELLLRDAFGEMKEIFTARFALRSLWRKQSGI